MTIYQKLNYTIDSCFREKNENYDQFPTATYSEMSLDRYKNLLVRNFQIHRCIESQIEKILQKTPKSDLHAFFHSRLDWIRADLKLIGADEYSPFTTDFSSPRYSTLSHMLGGWYLLEGSMIGNRMIYKWLREYPELAHIDEFHFYKNYDRKVGKRWRQFHELIAIHADNHEESIDAAKDTFWFFSRVMLGQNEELQYINVA